MTCPLQKETPAILLDYCARALPADTLARMDAHVAMCENCRQELAAQQQVWSALDEFDVAELNVSADFDRRLYARIEMEQQEPFWVRAWRGVFASGQPGAWRPAFSMMAVAGVAVLALLLVRMPGENATVAVTGAATGAVEASAEEVAAPALKTAAVDKDVEGLDRALEDLEMLHVLGATGGAKATSAL